MIFMHIFFCPFVDRNKDVLRPRPKFDFAHLAKSATEDSDCKDCNRNQDAQIISHVMMNIGSLR